MPTLDFRLGEIKSLMPSVDPRALSGDTYVLAGQNYYFDSKGPKSGFSTQQLTPFPFSAPIDVQGKRVQGRTFIFTGDSILAWRTIVPFMWEPLISFTTSVVGGTRSPWQAIYLNGYFYFAHPVRGFFAAQAADATQKLWIHPKTDTSIPGLITGIRGMEVVRGRAILVNDTTIQWGAVSNLTNLTPALGGAGFQLISNYTKGTFVGLMTYEDGFVVYTDEGGVVAEYIGGDEVWRFYPLASQERPIGPYAMTVMSDASTLFLSQHGLMRSVNGAAPSDVTPDFNEYFRDYIAKSIMRKSIWRIDYDQVRQHIYVSESMDSQTYWRSFVLHPTMNKWGIFSDRVYGFLPLTNDQYGYVDAVGIPNYYTDSFNRGTEPDNALGLNRMYPRHEKQLSVPSSSAVSNADEINPAVAFESPELPQAAWYKPGSHYPQPSGVKGLDSWIEIGYLRPEVGYRAPGQMNNYSEGIIEIQRFTLGSIPSAAPETPDFTTEWKPEYFYGDSEDWSSIPAIVNGDAVFDLNALAGNVDLLTAPDDGGVDCLNFNRPTLIFIDDGVEDWNALDGAEDWSGPVSGLPRLTPRITLQSSDDGITFEEFTPQLARFNTAAWTYTQLSSGVHHRLRLEAIDPNEYFHIRFLDLTLNYVGHL